MRWGLVILLGFVLTPMLSAAELPVRRAGDTTGVMVPLGQAPGVKAIVFVFISSECPISQRYAPSLNRIATGRDVRQVEFYGVVSGSSSRADAARYAREYDLKFPVLFDGDSSLALWLKPTHVPEAFVVSPEGKVLYRGRIDDWYLEPGKPRARVEDHSLVNALAAVLAGRAPNPAQTKPVGCFFEELPKEEERFKGVTFNRHIAPILFSQCATCHRPGEVAPFSLLSQADAAKHGKQIARVVKDRTMPPWKAVAGYGHFLDERRLTTTEISLLRAWVEAGCPEGEKDDVCAVPKFTDGWQLGKPDLVLKMPAAFTIPAEGPDILQNFVIPIDLAVDQMVGAIEFRPGNRRVVHHALCYLDASGKARKLDEAEAGPGYSASKKGLGFFPSGSLAGWAPGTTPRFLPDGMGRHLKKGSDAVLQIHYHPSGKEEKDQSEVGVYFVRKPATKYIGGFALENWNIDIPAGEKNYHRKTAWTLPTETIFIGAAPHMHQLGKEMKCWAVLPDGKEVPLIHIRNWDFNWQDYHVYREPFKLPKGTRLHLEAWFDNSAENVANPSKPPRRVTFGEGTNDEMCMCIFEVTCEKVEDLLYLIGEDFKHRRLIERAIAETLRKE